MKKLFLAWQEPKSRHWFPIGCLEFDGSEYHFFYIQGVEKAKSEGFKSVHSLPDLDKIYHSTHLFPLFSNRLMTRSRPDYGRYIQSLNIPAGEDDPMTVLARSGGGKATDSYEVFPCPEIDENGNYHTYFFVRGLQYMPKCSIDRATQLQPQERLYLSHELQNSYDSNALLLHTDDRYNLGYCPRYLSHEIFPILQANPPLVEVFIDRVNLPPTPMQFRVLCSLTVKCDTLTGTVAKTFKPFTGEDYQPLPSDDSLLGTTATKNQLTAS
jgi:HIRAN domain